MRPRTLYMLAPLFFFTACSPGQQEEASESWVRFTSEHAGKTYCIGEEVEITWEAMPGFSNVFLYLTRPDSFRGITTVDAESAQQRRYIWKAGEVAHSDEEPFYEGYAYGFRIWAQYNKTAPLGGEVAVSEGVFSVLDCEHNMYPI